MSVETSKIETQKEEKTEKKQKQNRISKNCGTATKDIICVQWEYQKEMKERNRSNI